jgi:hypothetical protein
MRQIVRALLAQRQALLLPLPDGTYRFSQPPTFVDESDLSMTDKPHPLVSLRVEPAPSSVRAIVPVRVYETVWVLTDENYLKIVDEITDKIFEGVEEKPFFGFDATIVRATWAGTKYAVVTGSTRKTVTTWDVLVSWRAR